MVKIVIVGGGFGGLSAAKKLAKNSDLEIVIVDQRNYHLFQPLLYQVATAGLSPAEIAVPIRAELSEYKNVQVILGKVVDVNKSEKFVLTAQNQKFYFDYLILACGAKHSYFGHTEWEEFAPGLKTLEQATEIRRRILLAFELAEMETDLLKQKALLTFVVVGGGPTGVEMAGAIAEISHYTLKKDFRNIDPELTRVLLIEAGDRPLNSFSKKLSDSAIKDLEDLGVQVRTLSRVTAITADGVSLGTEFIESKTVFWGAGVEPSSLSKKVSVYLDRAGRVLVNHDLSLPDHERIFVIGDMSAFKRSDGTFLPGLAPVAMQQGRFVARQIRRSIAGKKREDFIYRDKGQMATIGRSKAVAQFKNLELSGFLAWMAWIFVHIYFLAGFKNKFFVFIDWVWSYLSFKKGSRLIVDKEWRSVPRSSSQ